MPIQHHKCRILVSQRSAASDTITSLIEPGSPWENWYNESLNGKLWNELLNREIFYTLEEAQVLVERWRRIHNKVRPHSALGYLTPLEFAHRARALRSPAAPSAPLLGPVPALLVSESLIGSPFSDTR